MQFRSLYESKDYRGRGRSSLYRSPFEREDHASNRCFLRGNRSETPRVTTTMTMVKGKPKTEPDDNGA